MLAWLSCRSLQAHVISGLDVMSSPPASHSTGSSPHTGAIPLVYPSSQTSRASPTPAYAQPGRSADPMRQNSSGTQSESSHSNSHSHSYAQTQGQSSSSNGSGAGPAQRAPNPERQASGTISSPLMGTVGSLGSLTIAGSQMGMGKDGEVVPVGFDEGVLRGLCEMDVSSARFDACSCMIRPAGGRRRRDIGEALRGT